MDDLNQQIADQLRTEAINWVCAGLARDENDALEQMRELLTRPAEPIRYWMRAEDIAASRNCSLDEALDAIRESYDPDDRDVDREPGA